MLTVKRMVDAVCAYCRTAGRCYEVESDDKSFKGDYCQKCIDRWLAPRSGIVKNGKKPKKDTKSEVGNVSLAKAN